MDKLQYKSFVEALVESYLNEAQIDNVIAQNPQYAQQLETFRDIHPRYLTWILKQIKLNPSFDSVKIHGLIKSFEESVKRNKIQIKDINQYKTVDELEKVVYEAEQQKTKTEQRAEERGDYETIYDDANWLIVLPLSTKASCFFGHGTKWCISAKEDNYFKQYVNHGLNFYFFINKKQKIKMDIGDGKEITVNPKIAIVVKADEPSTIKEVYNQNDELIYSIMNRNTTIEDIYDYVPENIISIALGIGQDNNDLLAKSLMVNEVSKGDLSIEQLERLMNDFPNFDFSKYYHYFANRIFEDFYNLGHHSNHIHDLIYFSELTKYPIDFKKVFSELLLANNKYEIDVFVNELQMVKQALEDGNRPDLSKILSELAKPYLVEQAHDLSMRLESLNKNNFNGELRLKQVLKILRDYDIPYNSKEILDFYIKKIDKQAQELFNQNSLYDISAEYRSLKDTTVYNAIDIVDYLAKDENDKFSMYKIISDHVPNKEQLKAFLLKTVEKTKNDAGFINQIHFLKELNIKYKLGLDDKIKEITNEEVQNTIINKLDSDEIKNDIVQYVTKLSYSLRNVDIPTETMNIILQKVYNIALERFDTLSNYSISTLQHYINDIIAKYKNAGQHLNFDLETFNTNIIKHLIAEYEKSGFRYTDLKQDILSKIRPRDRVDYYKYNKNEIANILNKLKEKYHDNPKAELTLKDLISYMGIQESIVPLRKLIESVVDEELKEFNALGTGNIVGYTGPVGMNTEPGHKKLWSGDKKLKKPIQKESMENLIDRLRMDTSRTHDVMNSGDKPESLHRKPIKKPVGIK